VPELLTADDFEPHVGTRFRLPDGGLELELGQVERHPPQAGLVREPFALVFTGPVESPLDQRIHRLEHDAMGELDVFLVPTGPGRYEAVFS
jgi:hypothetical protein